MLVYVYVYMFMLVYICINHSIYTYDIRENLHFSLSVCSSFPSTFCVLNSINSVYIYIYIYTMRKYDPRETEKHKRPTIVTGDDNVIVCPLSLLLILIVVTLILSLTTLLYRAM